MMRVQAVGVNETLTVGGMQQSLIGLSRIQRVGMKDGLKVGKTLSIEAGEKIELICGASKIVLTSSAIHLDSPSIHMLGGGATHIDGGTVNINIGSAQAASPEGPDEPEESALHIMKHVQAPPSPSSSVQSSPLIKITVATSAPETPVVP